MTHAHHLGVAVSFKRKIVSLYQKFLGELLLSAASVSALEFANVFASTGMIIWAAIGLVGLISGMVAVRGARCRNQPVEPAVNKTPVDTAAQPASVANAAQSPRQRNAGRLTPHRGNTVRPLPTGVAFCAMQPKNRQAED